MPEPLSTPGQPRAGGVRRVARRVRALPRWVRILGTLVLSAVALVYALHVLQGNGDELTAALADLGHIRAWWALAAGLAEVLSYVAYGQATRRLLRTGGVSTSLAAMTGVSLATQAIGDCLPAGVAAANLLGWRLLRGRGASDVLATWALAVLDVEAFAAIAALALLGAEVAGPTTDIPDISAIAGAVLGLCVVVVVTVWAVVHRRGLGGRLGRWLAPVRAMRLGWGWVTVSGWMLVFWLADATCLALAFPAIGVAPPARGLLVAYAAGQLAAALPITPGGIGVVEGSITVALVAYGGASVPTLAAVLLYRLFSYWSAIPLGGVSWLALKLTAPRPAGAVRAEPAVAVEVPS